MKEDIGVKAISNSLGHAKTMITVDVYGDKQEIISDCADEIQDFIEEMVGEEETHNANNCHDKENTFLDVNMTFGDELITELTGKGQTADE